MLLILHLLGHTVASPISNWQLNVTTDGKINLSFEGNHVIGSACPEVVLPPSTARTSMCDSKYYSDAIIRSPSRGHDSLLGNYTEQIVAYRPSTDIIKGVAVAPAAECALRFFDAPSAVLHVQLKFASPFKTNQVLPLGGAVWSIGSPKARILNMPQDNDLQSQFESVRAGLFTHGTSSYVTAMYDETLQHGLVAGFLEHDMWKSGIEYRGHKFSAVAGINGLLLTRDSEPHGMVTTVSTPLLSIGFYPDWRDGMEEFARMQKGAGNGKPVPLPAGWDAQPLAGWNSWAMAVSAWGQPNMSNLASVSNVLKGLRSSGFGPTQVIDRDAIYGLSDTQTHQWIENVTSAGQRAGSYDSHFAWYGNKQINIDCDGNECNDTSAAGCWTVHDILLKDFKGNPILDMGSKLEKGNRYIRDPTHPNTECVLRRRIEAMVALGYTLIKEDFMNLAAYEGVRHNMSLAPTGMAAYKYALDLVADAAAGRLVVNYGISLPLPVGPAGHARYHACEQMYGGVEYMMNNFAGSWWLNQLYTWLNPDSVTLREDYWFRPYLKPLSKWLSMDAKSRVAKAVVFGGIFWNSDDLFNSTTASFVQKLFGNPRVNAMWNTARAGRMGSTFRPVSWGRGWIVAPSVFARTNGDVAIFNYRPLGKVFSVNLKEAGMPTNTTIKCDDVWENTAVPVTTTSGGEHLLSLHIQGLSSSLIQCRAAVLFI